MFVLFLVFYLGISFQHIAHSQAKKIVIQIYMIFDNEAFYARISFTNLHWTSNLLLFSFFYEVVLIASLNFIY